MAETNNDRDMNHSDEYGKFFKCSKCSDDQRLAKSYCIQCKSYYCARCKRTFHDVTPANKTHQLLKGDDLPGEITINCDQPTRTIEYCFKHPARIIKRFCNYHKLLLCETCVKEEHYQCETDSVIEEDYLLAEKKLKELKEKLPSTIKKVEDRKKNVVQANEAMKRNKEELIKQVADGTEKMTSGIQRLKNRMIQNIEEMFSVGDGNGTDMVLAELLKQSRLLDDKDYLPNKTKSQQLELINGVGDKIASIERKFEESRPVEDSDSLVFEMNEFLVEAVTGAETIGNLKPSSE